MRGEARVALAGLAAALALLGGRMALLPEAPSRASVPRPESLERLTPYLAADSMRTVPEGGTPVRLARDPFGAVVAEPAGGGAAEPAAPRWSVSAIMISEGRRLAVVGDRLVEVGDRVEGGRVIAVERDHVLIVDPAGTRHRIGLNR